MDDDLLLGARAELPEALRVLARDFPRESWEGHPNFAGLVQFWLDRHGMFRRICATLGAEAEARLDKRLDPEVQAQRLARYGGLLVNELHGHHQIEDHHYFPVLMRAEPRLERGFALLEADHDAMDGLLDRFARSANGVIRGEGDPGAFRDELLTFEALLERHLTDEEELIVPVILSHGAEGLG